MTALAIMQPYFLPYIGYFQLMKAVDRFIVYDDVSFITRGWINRNRILIGQKPMTFVIPLAGASQNKLINEIAIVDDDHWRRKLQRSVELQGQQLERLVRRQAEAVRGWLGW